MPAGVAAGEEPKKGEGKFANDPEARALYDKMIGVLRKADTLSYTSHYRWEAKGKEIGSCTYTAWLAKPNHFRLETLKKDGQAGGTLIGDGKRLWIFWPDRRPFFSREDAETYKRTCRNVFMTEITPQGRHSIAHKTNLLGAGMSMTILNPSTFHGYTDSMQPYIDGVRSLEPEAVGKEACHVIEVSLMKGQRSWTLWLSKEDNLPRRLKQVVRVSYDIVTHERWESVILNANIPGILFAWKPPEGWTPWKMPPLKASLLKPGTPAPDFELASADDKTIKLSALRGKVVWLYIWRTG
jgi:outer membrane lipoprotein-sorting protein